MGGATFVPPMSFLDWTVVHPAVGARMRKIKELAPAKRARMEADTGTHIQHRPRIADNIVEMQQMWEIAMSTDGYAFGGACTICGMDSDECEHTLVTCALCMQTTHADCGTSLVNSLGKARILTLVGPMPH